MLTDYEINGDGLTSEQAEYYASTGKKLDEVFACDITGIMQDYDEAIRFISDVVVMGEDTTGYILVDWNFSVVGCEEDNILHLRVTGNIERI